MPSRPYTNYNCCYSVLVVSLENSGPDLSILKSRKSGFGTFGIPDSAKPSTLRYLIKYYFRLPCVEVCSVNKWNYITFMLYSCIPCISSSIYLSRISKAFISLVNDMLCTHVCLKIKYTWCYILFIMLPSCSWNEISNVFHSLS